MIKIERNVIFGQAKGALLRVQIGYTAVMIGSFRRQWQGLQWGFFAPVHDPETGYHRRGFYGDFLPGLSGSVPSWPTWYRRIWKFAQFKIGYAKD